MADCLHKTCAVCLTQFGKKSSKIQKITPAIETKIKTFVWSQYSLDVTNYPKVICNNCHRNLYDLDKNKVEYLGNWIVKISKIDRLHLRRSSNIKDIVDEISASNDSEHAKSSRLCSTCFGFVVQGVAHICTESRAVNNLIEAAEQLGPKYLERVASGILKHKMEAENICRGQKFQLATQGSPLNIVVGTPDKKTDRIELKQVSFGTVMELVKSLELSKNQTKNFCSKYRSSMGTQTCIEANIFEKIEALHNRIDEFYTSKEVGFMDGEEAITRTLVHVKDTSTFIQHVITERGIDPHDSILRIAMDSGQGFLKVTVNVFNPLEKTSSDSELDDAGVKRSFLIAIVEGVSEANDNLWKLIEPLNLNDVKFYVAFDLKCANSVFGISSHAGKYSCLYCEGSCTLEPGIKRTLRSLDDHYNNFTLDGKKKSKMSHFKNVTNPRLLYKEEDPETLLKELVPVPELHVLMGIVNKLAVLLVSVWPLFEKWLQSNYIMFRGYQGIGLDGNNASKFLKLVDILERDIINNGKYDLLPIVNCVRKFKCLQAEAFGMVAGDNISTAVLEFKKSYADLIEYVHATFEGIKLSVTWKVHIAVCHILPFLHSTDCGLGVYCEQTGEAIYHEFKKTWNRYKRRVNHIDYAKRLKSSVVEFASKNIK
ncbi:uncharacterized protein LOC136090576 isoform X2 [Hydra vulgaris]|uniref:Uncharacterized protein LOC136090576 isoform X2 n=1 Tax=Hydra vulgaris TaxID=6087 RepID=A0ABM4DG83_HYDVU